MDIQLFTASKQGDFAPPLSSYVPVYAEGIDDCANSSSLATVLYAQAHCSAPYAGISTENCLLNITQINPFDADQNIAEGSLFSKSDLIDLNSLRALGYESSQTSIPENATLIVPPLCSWLNSEYMSPVYRHVMWYWWHRRDTDFNILAPIIADQCPEYSADLESYREDTVGFPFGAAIMERSLLGTYAAWLKPLVAAYVSHLALDRDASWVESLAPDIVTRHLFAVFVKHLQRTQGTDGIYSAPLHYFSSLADPYLKPAFDNNNVAVVFAADSHYAPLLSVTIESILRNATGVNNYDLIVLDNGLLPADVDFLTQQVRPYDNASIRFIRVKDHLDSKSLPSLAHINQTTFARFLIFEYLQAYDKVAYLDCDLVCEDDVATLYNTDISDYMIAAVRDTADAGWSNIVDNGTRAYLTDVIQLENRYDYFNAGVLVFNIREFLSRTSVSELMEFSAQRTWKWMDQDILNHVCRGRVRFLDQRWNYMAHKEAYYSRETTPEVWLPPEMKTAYDEARENPSIVHYVGHSTPCFHLYADSAWRFWKYAETTPYREILSAMAKKYSADDPGIPFNEITGPLVSIIVPVYNSALFLDDLFDTLLRQTYPNLEILCVDNNSKDNSLAILQEYAKYDKRIVILQESKPGAGHARNLALRHATGKYITFVDSDDFIEEDAIERLVAVATRYHVDAVVYGIDQFDDQTGMFSPSPWSVVKFRIPARRVFRAAEITNFYTYLVGFTVNKLYRASLLKDLNITFPEIGAHEDLTFTYLALSAARSIYYLDETLYHYRRAREGSLSDNTASQYTYMFEALLELKKDLIERGLWEEHERNFANYAMHMCLWKNGELPRFDSLEFRDACRTHWLEELGVIEYPSDYFYKPEYAEFRNNVLNMRKSRKLAAEFYRRKTGRWSSSYSRPT